ncbi:MAG: hypothetical protein MPW14_25345 (plasmid) [Candidatus Manganitrophus sp.]|nr:MAG: hypothetical protein MPW14_25345 [Candidatus Manganitrophus sp.]
MKKGGAGETPGGPPFFLRGGEKGRGRGGCDAGEDALTGGGRARAGAREHGGEGWEEREEGKQKEARAAGRRTKEKRSVFHTTNLSRAGLKERRESARLERSPLSTLIYKPNASQQRSTPRTGMAAPDGGDFKRSDLWK